jgi:transposase-like protein
MNTGTLRAQPPRTRRKHTPEFKAQVIAECLQPGTSVAAVALANQLNANYLRSLVKKHRKQHCGLPATLKVHSAPSPAATLVPVAVQTAEPPSSGDIQIEIRRQQTAFQITWPASQAEACAQWLGDVLR